MSLCFVHHFFPHCESRYETTSVSSDPILCISLPLSSYCPLSGADPYDLPGCLAGSNLSLINTTSPTVIKITFWNYGCYDVTSPASEGLSQQLGISSMGPGSLTSCAYPASIHYLWSMTGPSCSFSHFHFYTCGFPSLCCPFSVQPFSNLLIHGD